MGFGSTKGVGAFDMLVVKVIGLVIDARLS